MKLSKEFFNYEFSGDKDHWKWELANHPRYTNPWTKEQAIKVRDEVLSNQEKAEKWGKFWKDKPQLEILLKSHEENKRLSSIIQKLTESFTPSGEPGIWTWNPEYLYMIITEELLTRKEGRS